MLSMLLVLLVSSCAATDPPAIDASAVDLQKMQGDWMVASMISGGMKMPNDEAQALFRTITRDQYSISRYSKVVNRGTLKIDATQSPRTIDAVPAGDPSKVKPVQGIYEFDGSRLRICNAQPGKPRPTAFESTAANGNTLIVWEPENK